MRVPISLFLVSLAGLIAALVLPGASDFVLLAAPAALASLFLTIRAWRGQRPMRQWIVVDGSNVMYWQDGTPQIAALRAVMAQIVTCGLEPLVLFDANAGYLLEGRYLHDQAFARLLGLPVRQVSVVPKGTPADPLILSAARNLSARVVTNDQYRDWAGDHPELETPGHLVPGGFRNGQAWLALERDGADEKRRPEGRR